MISNPVSQMFPKSVLFVSLMLLCVILIGGSTNKIVIPTIVTETPREKDSVILDKLEKKLKNYELTRKVE